MKLSKRERERERAEKERADKNGKEGSSMTGRFTPSE